MLNKTFRIDNIRHIETRLDPSTGLYVCMILHGDKYYAHASETPQEASLQAFNLLIKKAADHGCA